ncbi:MAG TPA: RNA polymerase sigma factor [Vicinamibacterales bacterium]|nr:RNA polymerase sigma factor [Vicinamibacterales bacterium]
MRTIVETDNRQDSSVELLAAAQSGNSDALNALLARYLPRMSRWASGRLPAGLRTMLDTGDLVQEAIINALRNIDTIEIRSEATLQTYLRRAVKNRIIDLYRRSSRRPARDTMPEDAIVKGPSPLDMAIGAETVEWYERALATLSDADQEAIFLSVELGMGSAEIAEQLGKPTPDAARMAVSRAIQRLAAEMKRQR